MRRADACVVEGVDAHAVGDAAGQAVEMERLAQQPVARAEHRAQRHMPAHAEHHFLPLAGAVGDAGAHFQLVLDHDRDGCFNDARLLRQTHHQAHAHGPAFCMWQTGVRGNGEGVAAGRWKVS